MISAILLAAGVSRRMGQMKQLLPFGNSNVIRAAIKNLQHTEITELIVVLGHQAELIADNIADLPVKIVLNKNYLTGMTSSVQAGLRALSPETKATLLALVDQPHIPIIVIDQLLDTYRQTQALVIKPQFQGQSGHPILIDTKLKDEILALPDDCGLNKVIKAHAAETIKIAVATGSILEDMDTPEDYQRIVDRLKV